MTSDEIRLELFKRRKNVGNMAHIARELNPPCRRQAIDGVVARTIVSRRIAMAVSDAIGLNPRVVFPEYFRKKKKM